MRAAKNRLTLAPALVAVMGLMYSPLCVLSCALSNCSSLEAASSPKESQQSSHCHRQQPKDQPAPLGNHHNPRLPRKDSNRCPGHSDGVALLSSPGKASTALQINVQPIAAPSETSYSSAYSFAVGSRGARSFRSPPKRAVISVYRI